MNEITILKELVKLEKVKSKLNPKNENLENDKNNELNYQIEKLNTDLEKINDKEYSDKAKRKISRQIQSYVTEINKKNRANLRICKNQGLSIENFLISIILKDLRIHVTDYYITIRIPYNLKYTSSNNQSIGIEELSDFLNSELILLNNIENSNFVKLRNFYNKFKLSIINKFVEN